jgi:type IV pilus assembly protein PilB
MTPELAQATTPTKGKGCFNCNETGYKGRRAVYEVMTLFEELKEFVINGASTTELKQEAIRMGMLTMRQSGLAMLREGITTIDEIVRVTAADGK